MLAVWGFHLKLVDLMYGPAKRAEAATGIHYKSTIALAALETGWGRYLIPDSNNPFNLPDEIDWMGDAVTVVLPIKVGSRYIKTAKNFKRYYSLDDSVVDLAIQLKKDLKLLKCISASCDVDLFVQYLQRARWIPPVPNDHRGTKGMLKRKRLVSRVLAAIEVYEKARS